MRGGGEVKGGGKTGAGDGGESEVRGSGPKDIRGGVMGKRSAEETHVLEREGKGGREVRWNAGDSVCTTEYTQTTERY